MGFQAEMHDSMKDHLMPVENQLSGILKPVLPRTDFINTLRGKILHLQTPVTIERYASWQFYMLLLLGIVSGALLLWMLGRIVNSLFTNRGKEKSDQMANNDE